MNTKYSEHNTPKTPATAFKIAVQTADFDQNTLYQQLRVASSVGGIVTFTGLVREFQAPIITAASPGTAPLTLEHYPGMTEQVLERIAHDAGTRWPLEAVTIIHRVGELTAGEQIVFVGVASAHRQAAFEACHFVIDLLKTRAPFWKKEGNRWVDAKQSDQSAAKRWLEDYA
ncbi:MAG TPA: molybdenum cofactor biosynthesis protein MoaE [Marinagarivorans sp.]